MYTLKRERAHCSRGKCSFSPNLSRKSATLRAQRSSVTTDQLVIDQPLATQNPVPKPDSEALTDDFPFVWLVILLEATIPGKFAHQMMVWLGVFWLFFGIWISEKQVFWIQLEYEHRSRSRLWGCLCPTPPPPPPSIEWNGVERDSCDPTFVELWPFGQSNPTEERQQTFGQFDWIRTKTDLGLTSVITGLELWSLVA